MVSLEDVIVERVYCRTLRKFAKLMFQGKVKAALRFVSDKSRGSSLLISAQVGESTVLDTGGAH